MTNNPNIIYSGVKVWFPASVRKNVFAKLTQYCKLKIRISSWKCCLVLLTITETNSSMQWKLSEKNHGRKICVETKLWNNLPYPPPHNISQNCHQTSLFLLNICCLWIMIKMVYPENFPWNFCTLLADSKLLGRGEGVRGVGGWVSRSFMKATEIELRHFRQELCSFRQNFWS